MNELHRKCCNNSRWWHGWSHGSSHGSGHGSHGFSQSGVLSSQQGGGSHGLSQSGVLSSQQGGGSQGLSQSGVLSSQQGGGSSHELSSSQRFCMVAACDAATNSAASATSRNLILLSRCSAERGGQKGLKRERREDSSKVLAAWYAKSPVF